MFFQETGDITDCDIGVICFSFEFLKQTVAQQKELPLHFAKTTQKSSKDVSFVAQKRVTDSFQFVSQLDRLAKKHAHVCCVYHPTPRFYIYEVNAEEEFAPLTETPEQCRAALLNLHTGWMRR